MTLLAKSDKCHLSLSGPVKQIGLGGRRMWECDTKCNSRLLCCLSGLGWNCLNDGVALRKEQDIKQFQKARLWIRMGCCIILLAVFFFFFASLECFLLYRLWLLRIKYIHSSIHPTIFRNFFQVNVKLTEKVKTWLSRVLGLFSPQVNNYIHVLIWN